VNKHTVLNSVFKHSKDHYYASFHYYSHKHFQGGYYVAYQYPSRKCTFLSYSNIKEIGTSPWELLTKEELKVVELLYG